MTINTSLGNLVKKLRTARKFTQEDLAAKLGVSRPYVSYIECGSRQPNLETIFRLCDALNIRVSDFMQQIKDQLHTPQPLPVSRG